MSSTSQSTNASSTHFLPRLTQHRGHADHGWLKTFHTFSFADYFDPSHESYGPLRVINEDRVMPPEGFGTHFHREFEIFSYIVSGELRHKDSMGNTEILPRGSLQMTSAGTGIAHSEYAHGSQPVHFLQIWSKPTTPRLKPTYFTRHFPDSSKLNKWVCVVAPLGAEGVDPSKRDAENGPAPVHSPLTLYATLLDIGVKLGKELKGRKGYIHLIMTSGYNTGKAQGATVKLKSESEEIMLREGDGAYLQIPINASELVVENVGDRKAELLVFDMS
ncbi:hypothetical protein AMATHDRAFT_45502 [Amanita thiersii Skay4041]|uniref:Pirin N-terminal domain-containing protein n=1 Tax=Amanita thiersii Skay4041 TaxID=703135 RepID=A0A2A9NQG5_9AGAR|nr:hypothetical protein AMATHDRAFT_45502 [Amanita thiersii Skay4041]